MARRRNQTIHREGKEAFGSQDYGIAISNIDALCVNVIRGTKVFPHTFNEIIPRLFSHLTIDILKKAYPVIQYPGGSNLFKITAHGEITLSRFDDIKMVVPNSKVVVKPVDAAIYASMNEVERVVREFAKAKHVLKWLDKHATLGAIRYYWPTVLSLIPGGGPFNGEVPASYREPDGIHKMLPFLRDTASTVASALLCPKSDYDNNLVVAIGEHSFHCYDQVVDVPRFALNV